MNESSGIRKAAILVASLDRQTADCVLDRMDPAQAARVRRAILDLDPIDPAERRRVVDEFFRMRPRMPAESPPGIELDGRLAQALACGRPATARGEGDEDESADASHFGFLRDAETEKLARWLGAERPQTIALVLSHLAPRQAGDVLARFAPALQVDVIRRLVDLEETDPEILGEVERALRARFSDEMLMRRRRVAGLAAVAGILKASDRRVGVGILDNLGRHDRQLAERLSPEPFDFDDLARLDGDALAAILQEAGPQRTMLALVGAPPRLVERFLHGLSESEARLVRQRLTHVGPTRLSDVDGARRQMAELARRLALQGRVALPDARNSRVTVESSSAA